jgi:YD repeat-containing protein
MKLLTGALTLLLASHAWGPSLPPHADRNRSAHKERFDRFTGIEDAHGAFRSCPRRSTWGRDAHSAHFRHDGLGQLAEVVAISGHMWRFEYAARGRVSKAMASLRDVDLTIKNNGAGLEVTIRDPSRSERCTVKLVPDASSSLQEPYLHRNDVPCAKLISKMGGLSGSKELTEHFSASSLTHSLTHSLAHLDQFQCLSCCDLCGVECEICKEIAAQSLLSRQLECITGVCSIRGFDSPECIICLAGALAIYFVELEICEDRYQACAIRCSLTHSGCFCGPSC